MAANRLVYDTNAVIRIINGSINPDKLKIEEDTEQAVSVVTRIELLSYPGISADEEHDIQEFLSGVDVIPLTTEVEFETIKIRRVNPRIKLPDAVIASTTVLLQASLVSGDLQLLALKWPGLRVWDIS
jgi:predicted nucleic acid-binding protein